MKKRLKSQEKKVIKRIKVALICEPPGSFATNEGAPAGYADLDKKRSVRGESKIRGRRWSVSRCLGNGFSFSRPTNILNEAKLTNTRGAKHYRVEVLPQTSVFALSTGYIQRILGHGPFKQSKA